MRQYINKTRIERLINKLITNCKTLEAYDEGLSKVSVDRDGRSFPVYSSEAGLRIAGAIVYGATHIHRSNIYCETSGHLSGGGVKKKKTLPTMITFLSISLVLS